MVRVGYVKGEVSTLVEKEVPQDEERSQVGKISNVSLHSLWLVKVDWTVRSNIVLMNLITLTNMKF